MSNGKNSFRHESLQDPNTIQALLKAVTEGMLEGRLVFSDENGEITLQPEGLLHLKLSASREENRCKFSIRVSWLVEDEKIKKQSLLSVSSRKV